LVVITAQEDGKATGRIRLKQVADASAESLEAAVQETVEPGDENKILLRTKYLTKLMIMHILSIIL
jgi:hypothetical protein